MDYMPQIEMEQLRRERGFENRLSQFYIYIIGFEVEV